VAACAARGGGWRPLLRRQAVSEAAISVAACGGVEIGGVLHRGRRQGRRPVASVASVAVAGVVTGGAGSGGGFCRWRRFGRRRAVCRGWAASCRAGAGAPVAAGEDLRVALWLAAAGDEVGAGSRSWLQAAAGGVVTAAVSSERGGRRAKGGCGSFPTTAVLYDLGRRSR